MSENDLNPQMHPSQEVLEDFVAGELHVCRRVMVEAHLAFCAMCRERVRSLMAPASALMKTEPALPVPDALWTKLALKLDAEASPQNVLDETPLPAGARAELPLRATPLEWDPYDQSSVAMISADPEEEMALFLVRTPPESVFPYHVHLGSEEMLVLTGGYTDDFGHLGTGDFRLYGAGTAHAPVMDPGVVCWAVTLIVGGLQFDG